MWAELSETHYSLRTDTAVHLTGRQNYATFVWSDVNGIKWNSSLSDQKRVFQLTEANTVRYTYLTWLQKGNTTDSLWDQRRRLQMMWIELQWNSSWPGLSNNQTINTINKYISDSCPGCQYVYAALCTNVNSFRVLKTDVKWNEICMSTVRWTAWLVYKYLPGTDSAYL